MSRSVNHVASKARRKKILKRTRGYFGKRKNVWTVAVNSWEKGQHAREYGMSYSVLMGNLAKKNVALNRKALADLAMNNPEAFKAIVDLVK